LISFNHETSRLHPYRAFGRDLHHWLASTIATVSLATARAKSRDVKRMADLKQISTAVELYSNANGYLPTNNYLPGGGWCTYVWNASFPQFINDI